jgi:hypothetical protein
MLVSRELAKQKRMALQEKAALPKNDAFGSLKKSPPVERKMLTVKEAKAIAAKKKSHRSSCGENILGDASVSNTES